MAIDKRIDDWYSIPMFESRPFTIKTGYDKICIEVSRIPTGWLVREYDKLMTFVPYNEIDINYLEKWQKCLNN